MSLYGALFTGVSSLAANSRAIGVSSNNIANVNTVGYKASISHFETMLARDTPAGSFSSGGVLARSQNMVTRQGLLTNTDSATDLAITGDGFFIVGRTATASAGTGDRMYTRAGAFSTDANGNLRNVQGFYLMGWQLDANGGLPTNLAALQPINIGQLTGTAQATDLVSLRANLQASTTAVAYAAGQMASGAVTPAFQRTIEIYDSQGAKQPIRLAFVKTGPNAWAYEAIYDGPAANIGGAGANPIAQGAVTFNSDGTLATPAAPISITVPWAAASGLTPQTFAVNIGSPGQASGITQFETPSTEISRSVNGAVFGRLAGVRVSEDGFVTALFDNGIERRVYKLPLATFANPDGLTTMNQNVWRVSDLSGPEIMLEANTGAAGSISSSTLESSTVDLAKEFTDMITTQRAYSAATRIISTADQMLQEVLTIKR